MNRQLRIEEYDRAGVKRIRAAIFVDGIGGKGYDIPTSAWGERHG